MRNFFIIVSFTILYACKPEVTFEDELSHYIFDTLKIKPSETGVQNILLLNPRTKCWSCYQGATRSLISANSDQNTTIVTSYDIARFLGSAYKSIVIDENERIFDLIPNEALNSKLLIFKDKKLIRDFVISNGNAKNLPQYLE